MNFYNVYRHPVRGHEAVKLGWSWPGFFFTWIWAFAKRMKSIAVALLIANLAICAIAGLSYQQLGHIDVVVRKDEHLMDSERLGAAERDEFILDRNKEKLEYGIWDFVFLGSLLATIVVSVVVGSKGNSWRREHLRQHGYTLLMSFEAPSSSEALTNVAPRPSAGGH